MSQSLPRKRPWLAALLGAIATGLGHLYLRRWRRGFAWVGLLLGVSVLIVDADAMEAFATRGAVDPLAIAPIVLVGTLSVLDAYLLAHAHNAVARGTVSLDRRCPECGRELDPDLAFCHWCSTELEDLEAAGPIDRDGTA